MSKKSLSPDSSRGSYAELPRVNQEIFDCITNNTKLVKGPPIKLEQDDVFQDR